MKKLLVICAIGIAELAIATTMGANAATVRCGSSWELCAQRGNGPGSKFDPDKTTRGNQRQIREGFIKKPQPR